MSDQKHALEAERATSKLKTEVDTRRVNEEDTSASVWVNDGRPGHKTSRLVGFAKLTTGNRLSGIILLVVPSLR